MFSAYTLAEAFDKAIDAYREADAWQEALALAIEHDYADVEGLVGDLSERLVENRRHVEAGRMWLDYARNVPESVAQFCRGLAFSEAIRVVRTHLSEASTS